MLDVAMLPTAEQVESWLDEVYGVQATRGAQPPDRVRTGALYPAAAAPFIDCGFEVIDRLALLERPLLAPIPRAGRASVEPAQLRRVRRRDVATIADIDQTAFPSGWCNDADSLARITSATPVARRRLATDSGLGSRRDVGFAIVGVAGSTGYLQRVAVRPDAQGRGVGRQLVDDALRWALRRGANRMLVNTAVDNTAALRMYRSAAFDLLDEQLVVLEHRRTP